MSLLRLFVLRSEQHYRGLLGFLGANWAASALQGKPLQVQVSEHKSKRSLEQNALYWKRLAEIEEGAWIDGRQFDRDAWHRHFGELFLPHLDLPGGKTCPVSTTKLDVSDFTEYMNKIEAYVATELGVELTA